MLRLMSTCCVSYQHAVSHVKRYLLVVTEVCNPDLDLASESITSVDSKLAQNVLRY